ncbi:MAG: alpha/beta hydrolase [Chitinophagaceae bacterium]|nr:alpha/beta hydrolase [Chitinophagaceae bacterium]
MAKEKQSNANVHFLFIDWQDNKNLLVLGHINEKGGRVTDISCTPEELKDEQLNRWLKGSSAVLLFHCMWGQQPLFHKLKYLNTFKEVLPSSNTQDIAVISFLWHAGGLNYKENWNRSFYKGNKLTAVVKRVNTFYNANTTVFCHSMGSRFFEGVLNDAAMSFERVILFSSDISSDTIDPAFQSIARSTESISVFRHQKDRVLLLSSYIHRNRRMGRTGPEYPNETITVYDMTNHIAGFQNHAHVNKRWAKEQLKRIFLQ